MAEQIVINNLLISYSKGKQHDNGPMLLFLHGWRSNKEVWNGITSNFKLQTLNWYALDFPGFGQSQISKQPMTLGDYTDVVEKFMEKLDLKEVIIIGHSFGGRVGIKLAAQQPHWLEKLVLVDSAAFSMQQERKRLMRFGAGIVRPFFKPNFMQPLRKIIYKQIGAEDYVATPELRETFVNIVNEDLTEDLKKVRLSTLLVWGSEDVETPIQDGKKMQSLIPGSELIILPKSGHFSFLDRPEEFIAILMKFVG